MGTSPKQARRSYLAALCHTVPEHIVEAVLARPDESAIASQTWEASVLHADLVGFGVLCQGLAGRGAGGLGRLSSILNELFEALLSEAIAPYGGYVVHFGGDSVTALFRGPDDAWRAAAAALTAQRVMFGEAGRLVRGKSRDLMLRVGLARGEVRLPVLGDTSRRLVACSGATAHRALSLQHAADPNTILADAALLAQIDAHVETVDRRDGSAILRGMRRWPEGQVTTRRFGDLDAAQEEKIALLQPFVPHPLASWLGARSADDWPLVGELRRVVVVCMHVWGLDEGPARFTEAQDVSRSLLRAFNKYGGLVVRADLADRGHRVTIAFGLHKPLVNESERALLAALEAATLIKRLTPSNASPIRMSAAVTSGRAYVGVVGAKRRHELAVVGDAVNLASRLAVDADPFVTLATSSVMGQVRRGFVYERQETLPAAAGKKSTGLYLVREAVVSDARYVQHRAKPRFFAGRKDERRMLASWAKSALRGHSMLASIRGEMGIGKSALLGPLFDGWRRGERVAVLGRCRYSTKSQPFAPVLSMFSEFFGLTGREDRAARQRLIREGLRAFSLPGGGSELVAVLDPPVRREGPAELPHELSDTHVRERLLDTVVRFVEQRAAQQPVLYVLEDLQYADTLTLDLVRCLSAVSRRGRGLVVGTYRPDPVVDPLRELFDAELELSRLGAADTVVLAKHELGASAIDDGLAAFLWERSGGNPGHLVELIHFLRDRNLLAVRAREVLPPREGLGFLEDVVPATLTTLALARLDDLAPLDRRVLRMASAIGRRFGGGLVAQVATPAVGTAGVAAVLEALEGHAIVLPSAHDDDGYMFADGVTRAVAYGTMDETERCGVHGRIADALESATTVLEPGRMTSIAMHRERAGQHALAARSYERATGATLRAGLYVEGRELVRRWEFVTARLAASEKPTPAGIARMTLARLIIAAQLGEVGAALQAGRQLDTVMRDALGEAERQVATYWTARVLLDVGEVLPARRVFEGLWRSGVVGALRVEVAFGLARCLAIEGQGDAAVGFLKEAQDISGQDAYRQARHDLEIAALDATRGHRLRARQMLLRVLDGARAASQQSVEAEGRLLLGMLETEEDLLAAACESLERAVIVCRALSNRQQLARGELGLGGARLWQGDAERAERHLERALALAQEIEDVRLAAFAKTHLGAARAQSSAPEQGLAMCREGEQELSALGARRETAIGALHLARVTAFRGDPASARGMLPALRGDDALKAPLYQRLLVELADRVRA